MVRTLSHAGANEPGGRRLGLALCLSGGGFRAALFHLGALRRLNELGILSQIDIVSSVSGGSVIAAHLAETIRSWPEAGGTLGEWDSIVSNPFHAFVKRNMRTPALLRRLAPKNWTKSETAVEALAEILRRRLTQLKLSELPERPRFILSATELTFGTNWVFEATRMGNSLAGHGPPSREWTVARAVAASSCFPPVFDPMPVNMQPHQLRGGRAKRESRNELNRHLCLTDGGVYDNLGLEPVWKSAKTVLVSDGGGIFSVGPQIGAAKRLLRYMSIVGNQSAAIRKRWLVAGLATGRIEGVYWGIGSTPGDYGASVGYSSELVQSVVAKVRTDFDAFSESEIRVLENHGYLMVDAAIKRHLPALIQTPAPIRIPWPEWLNEESIRPGLSGSHARTLLGRW